MEDCKILYEGDEDQNLKAGLLEELGFKNIGVTDEYSKCWLMTYDTVGFKHVCTDEGFAELKELTLPQLRDLVAQSKSNEQGLISGSDAKLAWANGNSVQLRPKTPSETWEDLSGKHSLDIFDQVISYEFRLKPRTIKVEFPATLNREPAPKTPYFYLRPDWENGFCQTTWEGLPVDKKRFENGIWLLEKDAVEAVAALRGLRDDTRRF